MKLSKDQILELLIYAVLWSLLFTAPVLSLYVRTDDSAVGSFNWDEVFIVWRQLAIFFAFFLIHNFLLAPLIVYQQRRILYMGVFAVLVGSFIVYECSNRPNFSRQHPPMHQDRRLRPPEPDMAQLPDFAPHPDRMQPENDIHPRPKLPGPDDQRPPLLFGQRDVVSVIIFLLMLVANLGLKNYFHQRRRQQQLAELEHQNLEQQLEYLKYQLNPHFLMNTLNNIHALVDVNPEQAKDAIIQLSKILRYVLYESNHERVPLSKEIEFMHNYTDLMRMRYGKKLTFTANAADNIAGQRVAPLLFIAFVENAFKHGVSYQQPSFITIEGKHYLGKSKEQRLLWTCCNSKHQRQQPSHTPQQGGVGMVNVRQRLDLIYGDNYSLGINETEDTYEVILDIPLEA